MLCFSNYQEGQQDFLKLIPRTHDDDIYSLRVSAEICNLNTDSVYMAVLPECTHLPMSSPGTFGTFYAGGKVVLVMVVAQMRHLLL